MTIVPEWFTNHHTVDKSLENFSKKLKINRICSIKFALQTN